MKKIYLLPLLVLFFTACSVDDSAELLNQEIVEEVFFDSLKEEFNGSGPKEAPQNDCFNGLAAHVSMDVSGGLNNPAVNFVADVPLTVSPGLAYVVKVEVQQLADCEDFNVVTGDPVFLGGRSYTNVAMAFPSVTVQPNQLPVCYKWRMVFERSGRLIQTPCKALSPWYDAPLF